MIDQKEMLQAEGDSCFFLVSGACLELPTDPHQRSVETLYERSVRRYPQMEVMNKELRSV